jgi:hypothetical protein
MNDQSPTNVSIYLSLAIATATFAGAAVALGLLHCIRSRHRVEATLTLLFGTVGIVAALATVAAARSSVAGNILIGLGLLVTGAWVLRRALQLSYTVRHMKYLETQSSPTQSASVTWTQGWADENLSPPLGTRDEGRILWGPFLAALSLCLFAVLVVVTVLYPGMFDNFARSRQVGEFENFCRQNPGVKC